MKMTAYMRKAYTYNIQLQRTQQTAHSACSVYYVVNISGTAESAYSCIETNTMSQARRPFTLENLSFHNILPTKGLLTAVQQLLGQNDRGSDFTPRTSHPLLWRWPRWNITSAHHFCQLSNGLRACALQMKL